MNLLWLVASSRSARAAMLTALGITLVVSLEISREPGHSALDIWLTVSRVTVLVATIAIAVYLQLLANGRQAGQLELLRSLLRAHRRSVGWRATVADILLRLGQAIDHQYDRWGYSPDERETASLLLKGFDCAEIAALRDVSERIVRRDISSVYAKAGLTDRFELSAYFLDDLR